MRHLDDPPRDCAACSGQGRRLYGSTGTWRGGIGGMCMTTGQCDVCWGSGSQSRPWPNVRELEQRERELTEEQVAAWLARQSGATLIEPTIFAELLRVMERETRRRKLPEGLHPFWYAETAEILVAMLRKLHAAAQRTKATKETT